MIVSQNQFRLLVGAFLVTITITVAMFLVGAFSRKEESPTITVSSFFSTYNLTRNGPLFLQFS